MSDTSTVSRKPDRGAPAGRPLINQCLPAGRSGSFRRSSWERRAGMGESGWWLDSQAAGQPWPFDVAGCR
jgi:hypothetical protein